MRNNASLERAVRVLCPQIADRAESITAPDDEETLWRELTCCILGSQVRNEVAQAATETLFRSCIPWSSGTYTHLKNQAEAVLRKPVCVNSRWVKYRFPESRARYFAGAVLNVRACEGSLSNLVARHDDSRQLRESLVELVPGVGYKQASMFLRNIGVTYRLAILDAHVLDFMDFIGLTRRDKIRSLSKKLYLERERVLDNYANYVGYDLGVVDLAIWVVMRTAKAEGYV